MPGALGKTFYDTNLTKKLDAEELAKCDVIVTTTMRLHKEGSSDNAKALSSEGYVSPLARIRFFRVMVDEGNSRKSNVQPVRIRVKTAQLVHYESSFVRTAPR